MTTILIDDIQKHAIPGYCGNPLYPIGAIERASSTLVTLPDGSRLAIRDEEEANVEYALFEFGHDGPDGLHLQLVFHGWGCGGSLREMRHTYWGARPNAPDGYSFYLPGRAVIAALQYLTRYFDMD